LRCSVLEHRGTRCDALRFPARGASVSRSQEVRRLLERLSAEAASRGMVSLRLETNRSLSEAKHLYERAGFVEVEPFNNAQRTTVPEPLWSLVCGNPAGFAVPAVVVDSALARK
jgi:hypothetical protein